MDEPNSFVSALDSLEVFLDATLPSEQSSGTDAETFSSAASHLIAVASHAAEVRVNAHHTGISETLGAVAPSLAHPITKALQRVVVYGLDADTAVHGIEKRRRLVLALNDEVTEIEQEIARIRKDTLTALEETKHDGPPCSRGRSVDDFCPHLTCLFQDICGPYSLRQRVLTGAKFHEEAVIDEGALKQRGAALCAKYADRECYPQSVSCSPLYAPEAVVHVTDVFLKHAHAPSTPRRTLRFSCQCDKKGNAGHVFVTCLGGLLPLWLAFPSLVLANSVEEAHSQLRANVVAYQWAQVSETELLQLQNDEEFEKPALPRAFSAFPLDTVLCTVLQDMAGTPASLSIDPEVSLEHYAGGLFCPSLDFGVFVDGMKGQYHGGALCFQEEAAEAAPQETQEPSYQHFLSRCRAVMGWMPQADVHEAAAQEAKKKPAEARRSGRGRGGRKGATRPRQEGESVSAKPKEERGSLWKS